MYKSPIEIEPLSLTFCALNRYFIHHPSTNVKYYLISHKSAMENFGRQYNSKRFYPTQHNMAGEPMGLNLSH